MNKWWKSPWVSLLEVEKIPNKIELNWIFNFIYPCAPIWDGPVTRGVFQSDMAKIVLKLPLSKTVRAHGGVLYIIVTKLLTLKMMYNICATNFSGLIARMGLKILALSNWKEPILDNIPHFACISWDILLGVELPLYTILNLINNTECMLSEKWRGRQYRSSKRVGIILVETSIVMM